MRRPRKGTSSRLIAESQRLVIFAQALVQAGSRLEERTWERSLDATVLQLLEARHQDAIESALDQLFTSQSEAYDALMEAVEAASESCVLDHDGKKVDALLIAMPVLCWTRFSIPTAQIPTEMLQAIHARLQAHLLAPGARAAVGPNLYSIDQLPRSPGETHELTQKMALAALSGGTLKPLANPAETPPFLADARFIVAAITAPSGTPLFQWQTVEPPQDIAAAQAEALIRWRAEMTPDMTTLLPGCSIELTLPNAYAHALRLAEKGIRPASIFAADYFLTQTLDIPSTDLQANIGAFGDESGDGHVDEYRIGFSIGQDPDVVYGVVWPLFGPEITGGTLEPEAYERMLPASRPAAALTGQITPLEEILALLCQTGITRIKQHDELFAMEFCEDCGAPLYPDPTGELVHAELPEDAPAAPSHFH